jgi:ABC-type Fe2+-enterobactin transport system substrate-binding protein
VVEENYQRVTLYIASKIKEERVLCSKKYEELDKIVKSEYEPKFKSILSSMENFNTEHEAMNEKFDSKLGNFDQKLTDFIQKQKITLKKEFYNVNCEIQNVAQKSSKNKKLLDSYGERMAKFEQILRNNKKGEELERFLTTEESKVSEQVAQWSFELVRKNTEGKDKVNIMSK